MVLFIISTTIASIMSIAFFSALIIMPIIERRQWLTSCDIYQIPWDERVKVAHLVDVNDGIWEWNYTV